MGDGTSTDPTLIRWNNVMVRVKDGTDITDVSKVTEQDITEIHCIVHGNSISRYLGRTMGGADDDEEETNFLFDDALEQINGQGSFQCDECLALTRRRETYSDDGKDDLALYKKTRSRYAPGSYIAIQLTPPSGPVDTTGSNVTTLSGGSGWRKILTPKSRSRYARTSPGGSPLKKVTSANEFVADWMEEDRKDREDREKQAKDGSGSVASIDSASDMDSDA